jgi:4-hydroxybenzoate polyprenyl transferase
MKKINLFVDLARIKKPIGFMLLFWPCLWGITVTYNFEDQFFDFFKYSILFFFGAVLMRSAGCIINDIADRNYDSKVERTKNRPIASGKISIVEGLICSCILCLCALVVLVQFNKFTIALALFSMPLAFTYPLIKRYTYWPQLFLGITFNYGLILGWTSINESLNIIPFIFYLGAIFWTLGYDTIYGFQDIKDDEIIGIKSTSIKFKKDPYTFLKLCYLVFYICFLIMGILMEFKYLFFFFSIFIFLHLFFYQLKNLDVKSTSSCLKIFRSNNIFGLLVFINIILGKL